MGARQGQDVPVPAVRGRFGLGGLVPPARLESLAAERRGSGFSVRIGHLQGVFHRVVHGIQGLTPLVPPSGGVGLESEEPIRPVHSRANARGR